MITGIIHNLEQMLAISGAQSQSPGKGADGRVTGFLAQLMNSCRSCDVADGVADSNAAGLVGELTAVPEDGSAITVNIQLNTAAIESLQEGASAGVSGSADNKVEATISWETAEGEEMAIPAEFPSSFVMQLLAGLDHDKVAPQDTVQDVGNVVATREVPEVQSIDSVPVEVIPDMKDDGVPLSQNITVDDTQQQNVPVNDIRDSAPVTIQDIDINVPRESLRTAKTIPVTVDTDDRSYHVSVQVVDTEAGKAENVPVSSNQITSAQTFETSDAVSANVTRSTRPTVASQPAVVASDQNQPIIVTVEDAVPVDDSNTVTVNKTSGSEATETTFYRLDRPPQATVATHSLPTSKVTSASNTRVDGMRVLAGYLAENGTVEIVFETDTPSQPSRVIRIVTDHDGVAKSTRFADTEAMDAVQVFERRRPVIHTANPEVRSDVAVTDMVDPEVMVDTVDAPEAISSSTTVSTANETAHKVDEVPLTGMVKNTTGSNNTMEVVSSGEIDTPDTPSITVHTDNAGRKDTGVTPKDAEVLIEENADVQVAPPGSDKPQKDLTEHDISHVQRQRVISGRFKAHEAGGTVHENSRNIPLENVDAAVTQERIDTAPAKPAVTEPVINTDETLIETPAQKAVMPESLTSAADTEQAVHQDVVIPENNNSPSTVQRPSQADSGRVESPAHVLEKVEITDTVKASVQSNQPDDASADQVRTTRTSNVQRSDMSSDSEPVQIKRPVINNGQFYNNIEKSNANIVQSDITISQGVEQPAADKTTIYRSVESMRIITSQPESMDSTETLISNTESMDASSQGETVKQVHIPRMRRPVDIADAPKNNENLSSIKMVDTSQEQEFVAVETPDNVEIIPPHDHRKPQVHKTEDNVPANQRETSTVIRSDAVKAATVETAERDTRTVVKKVDVASAHAVDSDMPADHADDSRSETGGDTGTHDSGTADRTVKDAVESGVFKTEAAHGDTLQDTASAPGSHAEELTYSDDGAQAIQSHRVETATPLADTAPAQVRVEPQAQKVFDTSNELARYVMKHDNEFSREVEDRMSRSIVTHARIMVRDGESRADIHVDPPTLGKMKLELVTENSKVTGRITVENHEVRDLVQNNLSDLRHQMAQNGLSVESFDVQVGHNDGSDAWANRERQEYLADSGRRSETAAHEDGTQQHDRRPRRQRMSRNRSMNADYLDVWM